MNGRVDEGLDRHPLFDFLKGVMIGTIEHSDSWASSPGSGSAEHQVIFMPKHRVSKHPKGNWKRNQYQWFP